MYMCSPFRAGAVGLVPWATSCSSRCPAINQVESNLQGQSSRSSYDMFAGTCCTSACMKHLAFLDKTLISPGVGVVY